MNLPSLLKPVDNLQNLSQGQAKRFTFELDYVLDLTIENEEPDIQRLRRINKDFVDVSLHFFQLHQRDFNILFNICVGVMFHIQIKLLLTSELEKLFLHVEVGLDSSKCHRKLGRGITDLI